MPEPLPPAAFADALASAVPWEAVRTAAEAVGRAPEADAARLAASFDLPLAAPDLDADTNAAAHRRTALYDFWGAFFVAEYVDAKDAERARRAEAFVAALVEALGRAPMDTEEDLRRLTAFTEAVTEAYRQAPWWSVRQGVGQAWDAHAAPLVAAFERASEAVATLEPLDVSGPRLPDGRPTDVLLARMNRRHDAERAPERLAALVWQASADGPAVYDALAPAIEAHLARSAGAAYLLHYPYQQASKWRGRLVALLSRALTEPAFAGCKAVLDWARDAVYEEKASGLKTFAKALAKAAAAWPDAAFDAFLHGAILPEVSRDGTFTPAAWDAQARALRREPNRRAVVDALHALGRATPAAAVLARLHADAHAAPDAAPAPEPDPGLVPDVGLRLALLAALRAQTLLPPFDPYAFAKAYEGREIDLEAEGYDGPIPELVDAYLAPALTAERLARVKRLELEFGGPPFDALGAVFPHDDGESDPRPFHVASFAGLEGCTALRDVSFFLCNDVHALDADLGVLLALPALETARLDLDPTPEYVALAQALRQKGVAVSGSLVDARA